MVKKFNLGEAIEIPTKSPQPVTLPILEDRHLECLNEEEALAFGKFAKSGILQKIYEAQMTDIQEKLCATFGDDIDDKSIAIHIRELQYEHRAVRCSIETLNGLFD